MSVPTPIRKAPPPPFKASNVARGDSEDDKFNEQVDSVPLRKDSTSQYKSGFLGKLPTQQKTFSQIFGSGKSFPRRRWMVLSKTSCKLFYFKNKSDKEPMGEINLTSAIFNYDPEDHEGLFTIESEGVLHHLVAGDDTNRQYWLEELQSVRSHQSHEDDRDNILSNIEWYKSLTSTPSSVTSLVGDRSSSFSEKNDGGDVDIQSDNVRTSTMESKRQRPNTISLSKDLDSSSRNDSLEVSRSCGVTPASEKPIQESNSSNFESLLKKMSPGGSYRPFQRSRSFRSNSQDSKNSEESKTPVWKSMNFLSNSNVKNSRSASNFEGFSGIRQIGVDLKASFARNVSKNKKSITEAVLAEENTCLMCKYLLQEITKLEDKLDVRTDEIKAAKEVIALLQQNLAMCHKDKETVSNLDKSKLTDENLLDILRFKDESLVSYEQQDCLQKNTISELTHEKEQLKHQLESLLHIVKAKTNAMNCISNELEDVKARYNLNSNSLQTSEDNIFEEPRTYPFSNLISSLNIFKGDEGGATSTFYTEPPLVLVSSKCNSNVSTPVQDSPSFEQVIDCLDSNQTLPPSSSDDAMQSLIENDTNLNQVDGMLSHRNVGHIEAPLLTKQDYKDLLNQLEKVTEERNNFQESFNAYKTQNGFLHRQIFDMSQASDAMRQRAERLSSECHVWEAQYQQMKSKYLVLLNDLHSPNYQKHDRETLARMLSDVLSFGPDIRSIRSNGREYDECGFCISAQDEQTLQRCAVYINRNSRATIQNKEEEEAAERAWESLLAAVNSTKSRTEMKSLIREKGVPLKYRSRVWTVLVELHVGEKRSQLPDSYYEDLLARCVIKENKDQNFCELDKKTKDQIELDLLRTLPNNRFYDSEYADNIIRLRRVLFAYALHNKEVSYCQGINRLAAIALLFLPEREAFWCLVCIVEHLMPQQYFTPKLLGPLVDQRALNDLVKEKLPLLHSHLEAQGISTTMITFNWFLCLFVEEVPPLIYLNIWDSFLLDGSKVLFRYSLAILKLCQDGLLTKNEFMEVSTYLRSVPDSIADIGILRQTAFQWANPLSGRYIRRLRGIHRGEVMNELAEQDIQREKYIQEQKNEVTAEQIFNEGETSGGDGKQNDEEIESYKTQEEEEVKRGIISEKKAVERSNIPEEEMERNNIPEEETVERSSIPGGEDLISF